MANDIRKGYQTGQQLVAKAVERAAIRREERTALKEAIDSGDWVTRDEILQERAGKKITKLLQWGLVLTLILLFVNIWYALLSVALIALRIYFIRQNVRSEITSPLLASATADEEEEQSFEEQAEALAPDEVVLGTWIPLAGTHPPIKKNWPLHIPATHTHRYRHTYIVAKTGSGKSYFLRNPILQDIRCGLNVVVLTHEKQMFDELLLPYFPPEREDGLVYFAPADTSAPIVGINPFVLEEGENLNEKAGQVYTIFERAMGGASVSVQRVLLSAVYALLALPNATLLDFERLIDPKDKTLREQVANSKSIDERTRKFWNDYHDLTAYEAIMRRLDPFLREPLSVTLTTPSFSFGDVLNRKSSVIFCDLSGFGGIQQQVAGQLVIAQIQQALAARNTLPTEQWRPTLVYIDEFQRYVTSEESLVDVFNGLRKFNVGFIVAHQNMEDLSTRLRGAIINNFGTIISMQTSMDSANFLAKELHLFESRQTRKAKTVAELDREYQEVYMLQRTDARDARLKSIHREREQARLREEMGDTDEGEITQRLRADVLTTLKQGEAVIRTLPMFIEPLTVCCQGPLHPYGLTKRGKDTAPTLIARSRALYGVIPPTPDDSASPDDTPAPSAPKRATRGRRSKYDDDAVVEIE